MADYSRNRVLSILGLAFMWPAFHNQVLYPFTLTFNKEGSGPVFYLYLIYVAIVAITVAVVAVSKDNGSRVLDNRSVVASIGALGIMGLFSLAVFGFESAASIAVIGIGAGLYAVFSSLYFCFWNIRMLAHSPNIIQDTVVSYAIACILQALRLALGIHTSWFSVACTVLTVACALLVGIQRIDVSGTVLQSAKAYPFKILGLAVLLLFMLTGGIIFINPPVAATEYPPASRAFMYVGCALICGVICVIQRLGRATPYRAALLSLAFLAMVSLVCMLVIGVGTSLLESLSNFPLIACRIVIEMFIWALILNVVQRKRLRFVVMMGVYLIAIVFLPNVFSALSLHMGFFEDNEDVVLLLTMAGAALVTCIVLNLILACSLFFSHKRDEGQPESVEDSLNRAFRAFQEVNEFSDRQMDVVRLAYRNWTAKRIGNELFISEGTVKTHLKTIYKRANLHSKQDIIDAVDAFL
ncbi:helix-turn-helix transcriptional regulator [Denitrobacterium detoxificans]|uniref:helix-turn-helix transcriptional regulator n=1 Tax=Denitrobacterium detoxificans TaxID=79604 RepID=UPI0026F09E26|nr:helix-turn-helix transcriptional regulator [Denitrobacterium detoxificans]